MREHLVVNVWTEASKPEADDHILIKLWWKGNKETGRVAPSARCVSVPNWTPQLDGKDALFVPMLTEAFNDYRRKMLSEHVLNEINNNGGLATFTIAASDFTPSAVLEAWENEEGQDNRRSKLSADAIKAWFETTLRDHLIVALADKIDGDVDDKKLEQLTNTANAYGKVLALLASPKPRVDIKQAKQLEKALAITPDAGKDMIFKKLSNKVETLLNPPTVEDLLGGL